jgi:hypothetical protein
LNAPQSSALVAAPQRALVEDAGRMSVANVVQQAMVIQEVMRAVMRENVHYGVIPGTDKPTLYKAGAEKLCLVFHVADEYRVEDLSASPDAIRYRVTCIGRHQQTGTEMGSGIGEAQTGEEKYRWRKAICRDEFEATPENLRRVKYARGKGGTFYTVDQVRTEPADLANTVLKMAAKRAKMAMVLNVLAASDAFGQDLEDLDEVLREHVTGSADGTPPPQAEPEWPQEAFFKWLGTKAQKAINDGAAHDAVLAFARAKGKLTAEQEAAIRALRKAEAQPTSAEVVAAGAAAVDPFVAEMNAAEGGTK